MSQRKRLPRSPVERRNTVKKSLCRNRRAIERTSAGSRRQSHVIDGEILARGVRDEHATDAAVTSVADLALVHTDAARTETAVQGHAVQGHADRAPRVSDGGRPSEEAIATTDGGPRVTNAPRGATNGAPAPSAAISAVAMTTDGSTIPAMRSA